MLRNHKLVLLGLGIAILPAAVHAQPVLEWSYSHAALQEGFTLDHPALRRDAAGYVHLAGLNWKSRLATLNQSGQQLFSADPSTRGENVCAGDVGFDGVSNSYLLSGTGSFTSNSSFGLAKVNLNGAFIYNLVYTPYPNNSDVVFRPYCFAVASDGTAYVAGTIHPKVRQPGEAFVVAVSPAGAIKWMKTWDKQANRDEVPVKVRIHPDGGVVVGIQTNVDVFNIGSDQGHMGALRYDADGNLLWSTVHETNSDNELASLMEVAPNGDVFVYGNGDRSHLMKIGKDGKEQFFCEDRSVLRNPVGMALDADENAYVLGESPYLQKWSHDGYLEWSRSLSVDAAFDEGADVKVNSAGNVYVAIRTGSSSDRDTVQMMIFKLAPDGGMMWPNSGGPFVKGGFQLPKGVTFLNGLDLDAHSNFYVVGSYGGDAWVGKYSEASVPAYLSFDSNGIAGSGTAVSTVRLSTPAPKGGMRLALASETPSIKLDADTVLIPEGQSLASFNISGLNEGSTVLTGTIKASNGQHSIEGSIPLYPKNDAEFTGQTVPNKMVAGQGYMATFSFRNIGQSTWSGDQRFTLVCADPNDDSIWNVSGLVLRNGPVEPGRAGAFSGLITAPQTPGTYTLQLQLLMNGIGTFGSPSTPTTVEVTASRR